MSVIFLVTSGTYDDYIVHRAFTTHEKALTYSGLLNAQTLIKANPTANVCAVQRHIVKEPDVRIETIVMDAAEQISWVCESGREHYPDHPKYHDEKYIVPRVPR